MPDVFKVPRRLSRAADGSFAVHCVVGVAVEIGGFAHFEAHMLVDGDVVFVVGLEIDGQVAAQFVRDAVQSALSARLGGNADVLDVRVAARVVISCRDLLRKAQILPASFIARTPVSVRKDMAAKGL